MKKGFLTRIIVLMLAICFVISAAWADYSQFYEGYCTRYAAQQFDSTAPSPQCNWGGDAREWLTNANAKGWQTTTSLTGPQIGAIVVWSGGTFGHVAYVTSCNSSSITIAEMNYGPTTLGHGKYGKNETAAQLQYRIDNAITDNWGVVTTTTFSYSDISHHGKDGHLAFVGYILPVRKGSVQIPTVQPPSQPTGLTTPSTVATATVPMSWSYPGSTNGITFQVSVNGPQNWQSGNVTGLSCTSLPLGPGHYTWTVTAINSAGSTTSTSASFFRYTPYDLNGDGSPDLVLRDRNTGDVSYRLLNGVTVIGGGILTYTYPWVDVVGITDLNGDGKPDLLLRDRNTGDVSYRLLNGVTVIGGGILTYTYPYVDVVGVADLNGDGSPDLMLRDTQTGTVSYRLLNGVTVIGGGTLTYTYPWVDVVGVADLNGDGSPDLILRDRNTGDVSYRLFNGVTVIGGGTLTYTYPYVDVVGAADFNGDGKPDLLLRDRNTGDVSYRLFNGVTVIGGGTLTYTYPWVDVVGMK